MAFGLAMFGNNVSSNDDILIKALTCQLFLVIDFFH